MLRRRSGSAFLKAAREPRSLALAHSLAGEPPAEARILFWGSQARLPESACQ